MATFDSIYVTDLVEVLISEHATETYVYGEVLKKSPEKVLVNFISKKDDIYVYEDDSYDIEYESINYVVGTKNGTKMHAAWQALGFEFRSEDELLRLDEIDSADEDDDWSLQKEQEESSDEELQESQEESQEAEDSEEEEQSA